MNIEMLVYEQMSMQPHHQEWSTPTYYSAADIIYDEEEAK